MKYLASIGGLMGYRNLLKEAHKALVISSEDKEGGEKEQAENQIRELEDMMDELSGFIATAVILIPENKVTSLIREKDLKSLVETSKVKKDDHVMIL